MTMSDAVHESWVRRLRLLLEETHAAALQVSSFGESPWGQQVVYALERVRLEVDYYEHDVKARRKAGA